MQFASFKDVVALWGSPDVLAGELGVSVFAARKWAYRDSIPADKWSAILSTPVARENGITAELLTRLAGRSSEMAEDQA